MRQDLSVGSRQSHPRSALRLRWKLLIGFGLVFGITLVLLFAAAMWGIPFTRYSGTYAADRSEAIRDLSLVADLKKEGLLRWLEERKNNARRLSNDEFVRSSVGQLVQSV